MEGHKSSQSQDATAGYTLGGAGPKIPDQPKFSIESGVVIDDYLMSDKIDAGGFGVVYLAQQKSIPRKVALKFIETPFKDLALNERFQREKTALGALNHPNIVNAINGGIYEGRPWYAMEYIEGPSITKYSDKKKLSVSERLKLFVQVCNAVEFAHGKGVVHCDIKPPNIRVTEKSSGEVLVKVIDFGIAKLITNNYVVSQTHQPHEVIGTPEYMSPEQTGLSPFGVDGRSDIYALGVLLCELLIGCLPVEMRGMTNSAKFAAVVEAEILEPSCKFSQMARLTQIRTALYRRAAPRQLKRMLKGELDAIVLNCLHKSPEKRYQSVRSLVVEIDAFLRRQSAYTRSKRKIATWFLIVLSAFTLVALVALVFVKQYVFETPQGLCWFMKTEFFYDNFPKTVKYHQTPSGEKVWDWMVKHSWFDKMDGVVPNVVNPNGNRVQIDYDGARKFALIFFRENGVLKFGDMYIAVDGEAKFGMNESRILNSTESAKKDFLSINAKSQLVIFNTYTN